MTPDPKAFKRRGRSEGRKEKKAEVRSNSCTTSGSHPDKSSKNAADKKVLANTESRAKQGLTVVATTEELTSAHETVGQAAFKLGTLYADMGYFGQITTVGKAIELVMNSELQEGIARGGECSNQNEHLWRKTPHLYDVAISMMRELRGCTHINYLVTREHIEAILRGEADVDTSVPGYQRRRTQTRILNMLNATDIWNSTRYVDDVGKNELHKHQGEVGDDDGKYNELVESLRSSRRELELEDFQLLSDGGKKRRLIVADIKMTNRERNQAKRKKQAIKLKRAKMTEMWVKAMEEVHVSETSDDTGRSALGRNKGGDSEDEDLNECITNEMRSVTTDHCAAIIGTTSGTPIAGEDESDVENSTGCIIYTKWKVLLRTTVLQSLGQHQQHQ
jgi:hypothetical protein